MPKDKPSYESKMPKKDKKKKAMDNYRQVMLGMAAKSKKGK